MLALGRLDFAALLAGQQPVGVPAEAPPRDGCSSRASRSQLEYLAVSLGGASRPARRRGGRGRSATDLEDARAPDSRYVRRMATFHDFDPLALWGFLTSGRYVRCPPGRTLLAEGAPSTAYYLTINGAVEKVLVRGDRRIRVGLAGPGKAFGYEGLIDGRPSPVTAITRERALLLVVPRDLFGRLFDGRGRGLARLPGRDPERPDGHAARDAAPVRPPRGEPVAPCPAGSPSPARSAARPRPARPRSRRAGTRSTRRWRRRPRSRSRTRTTAASAATCSPSCGAPAATPWRSTRAGRPPAR